MPVEPLTFRFLGTGTSAALPVGPCLAGVSKPSRDVGEFLKFYDEHSATDASPSTWLGYNPKGEWPASVPCHSCRAAVDRQVQDGWKNRRGNPSLVISRGGKNLLVDVGKTFREQSVRFFPRWGIKSIDAVLITHGHADAYNGLDDLREWCNRQGAAIPIFLTQTTFETVAASFPYLVDKTKASGGGDLPSLNFRIIKDDEELEVCGIHVQALPVEHGKYFTPAPEGKPDIAPSKPATPAPGKCCGDHGTATEEHKANGEQKDGAKADATNGKKEEVTYTPHPEQRVTSGYTPFLCLGFVFDRSLVYLSDFSLITDSQWAIVDRATAHHQLPITLIVDALWPVRPHTSHVSFPEAMSVAERIKPVHTWVLGMTHPTTHEQWARMGRSVKGSQEEDDVTTKELLRKVWDSYEMRTNGDKIKKWGGDVEPAWDGLGVTVDQEGVHEMPIGQGSAGGWDI